MIRGGAHLSRELRSRIGERLRETYEEMMDDVFPLPFRLRVKVL